MRGGVYMAVSGSAAGALVDFLENKYTEGQRVNLSSDAAGIKVMKSGFFGVTKFIGVTASTKSESAQIKETVDRVYARIQAVIPEATSDQKTRLSFLFGTKFRRYDYGRSKSVALTKLLRPRRLALRTMSTNTADPASSPDDRRKRTLLGKFMKLAAAQ